ncbi:glycerol dehydrogenase [Gluconacetobacter entanii]|uniref:Glycerol dehydrogenase n=2 Tax=Gluconacetobacter entanii TaxID=108528 RepID=A0ABT3KA63_9PROT|nr:glycerol dehydrogenase [Gluconacetobacter entanii]MBY4640035.1 glycerol dehydrogenase [Gluconacetobacter entanii]MCW4581391.1 glycerol dehydrogenase [Gluconacetobacter entanii]MCW4584769.1 glycerol dehydrogenase [Gluconacetobacter entanii]MCW4588183.1 glycerol dehydrogenase [Gluconacetobacter entanii]MCW4592258.1 glycerol dehydrogenase [Gluconacetobacter entanii]
MSAFTAPQTAGGWATLALAVVIIALGLPLVYMGAELAFLGGSWYYIIVGLAVTAAGVLMAMGRVAGGMLYLAAVAFTWLWALWEVGFDGWGLLPRVFGPTLLAIGVALSLPVLRRAQNARTTSVREIA